MAFDLCAALAERSGVTDADKEKDSFFPNNFGTAKTLFFLSANTVREKMV
jgi:hypothetical protein